MELRSGTEGYARGSAGTDSLQTEGISRKRLTPGWTRGVRLVFPQCSLGPSGAVCLGVRCAECASLAGPRSIGCTPTRHHRRHRQRVAALVVGLVAVRSAAESIRVADDLLELDDMAAGLDKIEETLPKLTVRDWLLLLVPPAVLAPRLIPSDRGSERYPVRLGLGNEALECAVEAALLRKNVGGFADVLEDVGSHSSLKSKKRIDGGPYPAGCVKRASGFQVGQTSVIASMNSFISSRLPPRNPVASQMSSA
jgi:hypothetical protein